MIFASATLLAATMVAQSAPALAAPAPVKAAALPVGLAAPGSAADNNLSAWIEQVEKDPNEFDQNLEEHCVESGGAACSLSFTQIQRIPGELKAETESIVQAVQNNPTLKAEVTADFGTQAGSRQTRAAGGFARGVKALIKAVPNNKAIQALAKNADDIGEVADNVSRHAYLQMGVQGGTTWSMAKSVIYSAPVLGDVFALGESIFDPNLTTAERVEGGVCATLSLVASAAAFAGPVGVAAGVVIGVGLAAYYAVKALWGWFAGGSEDWTRPPTTPQELFRNGAYLNWQSRTVPVGGFGKNKATPVTVSMVLQLGDTKVTRTVRQTLLIDSRWTNQAVNGAPVTYTVSAFDPNNKGTQGLSFVATWATSANYTIWQDGTVFAKGSCRRTGVRDGFLGYVVYDCVPPKTLTISAGHPAVFQVTDTYTLSKKYARLFCSRLPCAAKKNSYVFGGAALAVNAPNRDKVNLPTPYSIAVVSASAPTKE